MIKKFNRLLKKFGYEINNNLGNTNRLLNNFDIAFIIIYFLLTSINLWFFGVGKIAYWILIILSIRYILKYWKRFNDCKNNEGIPFTYLVPIIIYSLIIIIFAILFFALYSVNNTTVLLSLKCLVNVFYLIVSFFEFIDILVNMFEASPHNFS